MVANTPYNYYVKAYDAAGKYSNASNTIYVTTPPQPVVADTQPPTAPTLLSAVASQPTEVDLSWTASTDNVGVQGYQIVRNGSVLTAVTGITLSYSDRTVAANASYSYSIKAYDAAGNYSNASNTVYGTTPPQPVADTCPAPASGAFTGCYYNNTSLSGSPVFVRQDSQINFPSWPYMVPSSLDPANFSASWQGNFNFDTGTYSFIAYTSDGMRIYIDGNRVLDAWKDQGQTGYSAHLSLTQGLHLIRVEYYNQNNTGEASVYWAKND